MERNGIQTHRKVRVGQGRTRSDSPDLSDLPDTPEGWRSDKVYIETSPTTYLPGRDDRRSRKEKAVRPSGHNEATE